MVGWNFPSNNSGPIAGISDAGIETFKGTLIESLAREICQNSLDAVRDDKKPVRVEFKSFKKKLEGIKGILELREAFEKCAEYWGSEENEKAKNFFRRGIELFNKDEIDILRISDFNTTGLNGSDKEINSNWSNLIKGSGVSDKGGSAGGSFGIGKSAAFACSNLRTIFYSTLDKEGLVASQGVSRLASFKERGYITQGIGYYGIRDGNKAIQNMMSIDEEFDRLESGTDIYVVGFNSDEYWKMKMITSILDGFLVSIWKGMLEVIINDVAINKDTLNIIFEKYYDYISDNIKNYYDVLKTVKYPIVWDFNGLGNVLFYMLEKEDYCRKVFISRKSGMKIFEQNRFPRHISFAGVLILDGDNVNKFFRKLESPQHDKWEADRYEENPKLAERYKKELIKSLRECVNTLEKFDNSEELDIEGLGDLISDDSVTEGDKNKKEGISDTVNEVTIKKVEFDYKGNSSLGLNEAEEQGANVINVIGEFDGEGNFSGIENQGGILNDSTGGGKEGLGTDNPDGTSILDKLVRVIPINSRIICSNKSANEYKYIFEIKENIDDIYFTVTIKGEQGEEDAFISNAFLLNNKNQRLIVKNNKIYLNNLNAKGKSTILFNIDYNDYCSLGVDVYGFKK